MSGISVVNVGFFRVDSSTFVNIPMIGVPRDAEGGGGSGGGGGVGQGYRRCVGLLELVPEFVAAALGYIFGIPRAAEAIDPCPADPAASPPRQNGASTSRT